ncbi:MAG: ABC transporter substrate-binding protein [Pseudomonadota bacterium]
MIKRIWVIFLVLALALSAVIYFKQGKSKPIAYRLKWLFNTSVAGDIYAVANGYFEKAGLTVEIKEGSPEKNAINELELGYADFGVASADQVIRAIEKGAQIVVIAQLFQVNPMQWIYRADQPEIKQLQDLKGRRIGITFGGNDETIMKTVLAAAGIAQTDVTLTGVRFDFSPFLKRQVDVWPVYRNSQGVILEQQLAREGESVCFFNPADFGIHFVANSVITTRAMVDRNPKVVKQFLSALLKGWEDAMNPANETDVLDAVKKLDQGTQGIIQKEQLMVTRQLIQPLPSIRIGHIDTAAWQQTETIMLKEQQIKNPVNIETCLIQME